MSKNRWCFTVNNYGEWRPQFIEGDMDYLVYGLEVGEAGTPHVQGYVRFKNRKRLNTVKNIFERADMHLEPAKGTEQQNKTYCIKDGQFVEFGSYDPSVGTQGNRTDLAAIHTMIQTGATLAAIAAAFPADYIRYHGGIQALREVVAPLPPLERDVRVTVLWGPTGVGKTHRTRMDFPDIFSVEPGRDPWGGYQAQDAVVFDEFDYSRWTITSMNKYLDKWRLEVDARYHNKYAMWTRVVICANSSPLLWYVSEDGPLREALRRRLSTVIWVGTRAIATAMDLDSHQQDLATPLVL